MKKYTLKSLVQNGSHARKKIKSDVIIGDTNNGYGVGDILDANATMEQVNSKIDDVLGVNAENINSLIEILNDDDATTGILSQLNAKQDAITSDNKLNADLVADGTTNKAFTAAEKTKLSDIATGAEVNVQSDWNQTNISADDYIKNKPTLATVATSGSYNDLSDKPAITLNTILGDANGHDYVEIAGVKWATMNIGANSVTDTGLYFQWGDTQGYTQLQISSQENAMLSTSYKYGNGTDNAHSSQYIIKYNNTDGKTELESTDDAASYIFGGTWRLPTKDEFLSLFDNTTRTYTSNYKGTGKKGYIFTATDGSNSELFFSLAGVGSNGSVPDKTEVGKYWAKSRLQSDQLYADIMKIDFDGVSNIANSSCLRYLGLTIRPVLDCSTLGEAIASAAQQAVQQAAEQ